MFFSKRKAKVQEIRKWFNPEIVQLRRKNYNKEILIFPVGPLNVRLEIAKRVQLDHPNSSVTLLLRRDEQRIELPQVGLRTGCRLLSRCPLAYLKKSGIVPIYHNAWHKAFMKMAGLAFLSGASPISVYGEGGELLERKAASIFLR
jgi:hypothetical protein